MRRSTAVTVCVLLGAAWTLRSLLSFADPSVTDPATAVDWLAVLSLAAALGLMAPGMLALGLVAVPTTWIRAAAGIVAIGGLVGAAGTLLEDALAARSGGTFFVLGTAAVVAGLVAMTFALLAEEPRKLALLPVLTLVGVLALEAGGGVLVLAAWLWLAARIRSAAAR